METIIKGYLLINFKTSKIRLTKRLNKHRMGAFEIPVYLNIKVKIPDYTAPEFNLNIEIPETKIAEIVADTLLDGAEKNA